MDREFTEEDSWTVISDDAGTKDENKDKDVGTQPICISASDSSSSIDKEPINSHKNDLDADEEIIKEKDTLKLPSTEIDEDSDGISIISAHNSDMEDNNRHPDQDQDDVDDLKTQMKYECPKCEECKCQQALPLTPPPTPFEGDNNQLEKVEENREITEMEPQIDQQNQLKINYWIVALVVAILAAFMGTKVMGLRQAFELSSKIYEKQIIELKNENSMLLKQIEELKMSLNLKDGWGEREYKIPEYCLNVDGSPSDQVVCEQKRRKFDMQWHKNLKMQQELRNQKPELKKKREDFRKQPPQFNKINSDDFRIDLDSIINVEPEPAKTYEEQLEEATEKLFEKLANKQFLDDEKDLMYTSTVEGDPIPDGITNDEIEKKIQERSGEIKFNAGSQRKFVKIPADQDLDDLELDIAAGDKELIVEDKEENNSNKPIRSQWTNEGDDSQELSMENFNSEDFAEWHRKKLKNHENPYTEKPQKHKKNRDEENKDKKDNKNFKKLEEFNRFEEGSGRKKKEEKFRKYEAEKFKKTEENPEKQWKNKDDDKNKKRKFDGNPAEESKKMKHSKFQQSEESDESGEGVPRQDKKNRKNENKENQGKQRKFNGSSETFKRLDENVEKIKKFQQNASRMKKEINEKIRKLENDAEKFKKFDGNSDKFKKFDDNSEKFKKPKGDTDKNHEDGSLKHKKPYEKQEKNEKPGKYNENPGKFKKNPKSGEWHQNRMSSREESRMKADKQENWYIERSREREIRRVDVSTNDANTSST